MTEFPTIDYLTRPIKVNGKEVSTTELAIWGRIVLVALAEKQKIDKNFAQKFLDTKILIYINPENVDFS